MEHAFFDEYSHSDSVIHRLEPRVKILAFLLCILFIAFATGYNLKIFVPYSITVISLILLSKVPVAFIFKRVVSLLPFILMVTIFLPFIQSVEGGEKVSWGALTLPVSYNGIRLFVSVVMKSCLSVMLTTLLMVSTDFASLLKALEKLRVPSLLIMIISFMYRYVFVLEDELMKMRQAKECRSVGGSQWFHLKAQANMLGVLFLRAYERAEKVYLAMCSRGFDGHARSIYDSKIKTRDMLFLVFLAVILTLIKLYG